MTENFVSYKTAKILKDKGFNIPCFAFYDNKDELVYLTDLNEDPTAFSNNKASKFIAAATFDQIERWFREKYSIQFIYEDNHLYEPKPLPSGYQFFVTEYGFCIIGKNNKYFSDYNEMKEFAIISTIEWLEKEYGTDFFN